MFNKLSSNSPSHKIITLSILSFILLPLTSCTMIYYILIADAIDCKLEVNKNYIKNDCGLTNGVRFEKLMVVAKNEDSIPIDYYTTIRFECSFYYEDTTEIRTQWPNKLHFNKKNDHYNWSMDTTFFHYVKKEKYGSRQRIYEDSIIPTYSMLGINDTVPQIFNGSMSEYFIFNNTNYDLCPVQFEKQTWYYMEFFDPHFIDAFLYVDENYKFHSYGFDSGLSPF